MREKSSHKTLYHLIVSRKRVSLNNYSGLSSKDGFCKVAVWYEKKNCCLKLISRQKVQKAELTNQNSNILTAFKEAKHDVEVITVLLIKKLDNYKKKVY